MKRRTRSSFWLGLIAGALGAVLTTRALAGKRRMPGINLFQRELAKRRGLVQAAVLAARAQMRYDELCHLRPQFPQPALQRHLDTHLLPGLAMYQILREANGDTSSALTEMEGLLTARTLSHPYPVRALEITPDPFYAFRKLLALQMKIRFPSEGWHFLVKEDSDQRVAFDTQRCFYLDVLTAYGAPELTAAFCATDDVLMAMLPSAIEWKRTTTLGRGGDRCDFCWEYDNPRKNRRRRDTSTTLERKDSRDTDTLLARTVGL